MKYGYICFNLPKQTKIRDGYFAENITDIITQIYEIHIRSLCGFFTMKDILDIRKESGRNIKIWDKLPYYAKGYKSNKENLLSN